MKKNSEIKYEIKDGNIVIIMPIDTLMCAFNNHPDINGYYMVEDKEQFAKDIKELIADTFGYDQDTGLTGFQQFLDDIFLDMIENWTPSVIEIDGEGFEN